jgi:uncharacterized protein (DUF885 family)
MMETTQSFTALSEEFVEVTLRHDPVAATAVGIHDYDHELPDHSPDGFRAFASWLRDFDRRFSATASEQSLAGAQRIDHAWLRSRIDAIEIELDQLRTHTRNPVRYSECALTGVFLLLVRSFAPLAERKEAILSRLMKIPDYLLRVRANFEQVPAQVVKIAAEINSSAPSFVDEVMRVLLREFPGEAERIEFAGARARAGFLDYQKFLEGALLPAAAGSFAIGAPAMNDKLRREHLLKWDCDGLDRLGLEHIERTRSLLEEEARRLDSTRSWQEQVAAAKRRHPEPRNLREAYQEETDRALRFVRERNIAPLIEAGVEVIDTPVFDRAVIPYAAYLPAAPFDEDQTGYFFVTPIDLSRSHEEQAQQLEGHNYAGMPLTVLHEAYPGHHLQVGHANRSGSRLRRLADSNVFAEGWALYCEEMMYEEGFLLDPVSRLFQLKDLLWRACRVVIDVRLHTGRMGFDEAVNFLVEKAMIEHVNAVTEVKRYVLTPTQPMSYLIGKLEFLDLREEARRRLGAGFNLHDFHARLLSTGTVPMALAREELFESLGAGS